MSKKDEDGEDSARDAAPIVLVVTEQGRAMEHLHENSVLRVLYGEQAPRRVALVDYLETGSQTSELMWDLIYPHLDVGPLKLRLLEHFVHISANKLERFITSKVFYRAVYDHIREVTGLSGEEAQRVKAVVCNEDMLRIGRPLPEVVKRFFPNAAILIYRGSGVQPELFVPEEPAPEIHS